jgi:hypothetical protein
MGGVGEATTAATDQEQVEEAGATPEAEVGGGAVAEEMTGAEPEAGAEAAAGEETEAREEAEPEAEAEPQEEATPLRRSSRNKTVPMIDVTEALQLHQEFNSFGHDLVLTINLPLVNQEPRGKARAERVIIFILINTKHTCMINLTLKECPGCNGTPAPQFTRWQQEQSAVRISVRSVPMIQTLLKLRAEHILKYKQMRLWPMFDTTCHQPSVPS